MTNSDWITLFQIIPPEQHNTLLLVTESGVNLGIELVIRIEPAYLVFRGRVCGNTDEGRVFFLPYSHIDYVNINRIVKEQEIRELYEKHDAARSEPGETVAADELANGESEGESQPATADEPQPPARPSDPKLTPGRVPTRPVAPAPGTQKLPAAAAAGASPGNDTPTPSAARNSILERLRAQRSSPTGRPSIR
jgi:hypothetical protein